MATIGIGLIWVAVLLAQSQAPVDLTVALLVLLAVVLALALVTGPVLGVVTGLAAVVLVNWYLVPPFGTFEVASPDNLVALVVFALVAGVASVLVEVNARVRARAARSEERAALIGELVAKDSATGARDALERLRLALELDHLALVGDDAGAPADLLVVGGPSPDRTTLDVAVQGGYRLVGQGPARLAEDPQYVASLASAVVRAYEGDRMEVERRRAEQLAAVDAARTALLASVGHDLRTPLAGLRVAVDALLEPDGRLDEDLRRELLDTVDASTSRLSELITNLLDMSRLEAGVVAVVAEPTAVDAVVAAALLARRSGHEVEVDVSDTLPLVQCDPVLLERIVDNLVSNALRHGAPADGAPVLVRAAASDDGVELDVVDHGPGPGAVPDRTTARRRADAGAGLGLDIVRGFCRAMDAGLEFLETPGGGLTVRVRLPLAGGAP